MKPQYAEGQAVAFEEAADATTTLERSLASSNRLLDVWIVQIDEAHGLDEDYKWSSIALPHGCLRALPDEPKAEGKP